MRKSLVVTLCVAIAACAPASNAPFASVSQANAYMAQGQSLNPGDSLRITVFDEPNLTGEYSLDPAGSIAFPLIGQIVAGGKTTSALTEEISDKLLQGGFVLVPKVNIEVLGFRPVYILGEVNQPGEYPYTSDLTLLQAIAKAGGYTPRANQKVITLQRPAWGGERQIELGSEPLMIAPGDTIMVRESFF